MGNAPSSAGSKGKGKQQQQQKQQGRAVSTMAAQASQQQQQAQVEHTDVCVVGAGISGLYAAQLLQARFRVLVLEAQDTVGGRIKQVHGLAPWPLQAGPEFVHGRHSLFVHLAQWLGMGFEEKEWPEWWWFGKEQRLVRNEDVDEEVQKVHELFASAADEPHPPPGADVSALDWLLSKGATPKMVSVADASYANDFCASLKQVGLREMIEENRRWDSGETYLVLDRSICAVPEALARRLTVHTSCPATRIVYTPQQQKKGDKKEKKEEKGKQQAAAGGAQPGVVARVTLVGGASGKEGSASSSRPVRLEISAPGDQPAPRVVVHCQDGRQVHAQAVLVTAPLPILKDGTLSFSPPLPAPKAAAMGRVKMGSVAKVMLTFSRQFWPDDMYDVVCTDSFVPEFWMLKYPPPAPPPTSPLCTAGSGSPFASAAVAAAAAAGPDAPTSAYPLHPHCIVGFVAGSKAEALGGMHDEDVVLQFLAQLDAIFASTGCASPASSCLAAWRVYDWAKEPWVKGAYTYPSLGAELGDREALAEPVEGCVFFAGEACNTALNPCVQGAMATAQKAALEIALSLQPNRP